MRKKKIFSIVVPVYQNEANLNETVPKLLNLQEQLPNHSLELVFVEDGSSDASYNILYDYQKRHKDNITLVKLTKNFGQIAAIQAGLQISSGDCVGVISADLQDPHELFVDMVKKWEEGVKLVIAERKGREESIRQSFFSNIYWKMVNRYAVENYPAGGYDFFLIDRKIVEDVVNINEKNTHIMVLIFSLGYRYEIIEYTRKERKAGKSQWTLSKKIKLFIDTFVSFSYLPIRGISYTGLGISLLSFCYATIIGIGRFIFGNPIEGWTTIVILIAIFGGLILLTLGIIGEYIWRILDETRKRPSFVIDKIIDKDYGKAR
ncbi:MAG: glycosyltransferase family 2 protein [bacterium]|nr:glycosyltransferase family 2 protein [bacterium]